MPLQEKEVEHPLGVQSTILNMVYPEDPRPGMSFTFAKHGRHGLLYQAPLFGVVNGHLRSYNWTPRIGGPGRDIYEAYA